MYNGSIEMPDLLARSWRFLRSDGSVISNRLRLLEDGRIDGHEHENEHKWGPFEDAIAFFNRVGQITTIFNEMVAPGQSGQIQCFRGRLKNTEIRLVLCEVDTLQERLDGLATVVVEKINKDVFGRNYDSYDVVRMAELRAAFEASEYYVQHMRTAKAFEDKNNLLRHALRLRRFAGLCLEFGVATGATINVIAGEVEEKVYGFDVFTGLPETWRTGYEIGAFAQDVPATANNVELVVGLFERSLPSFVKSHPIPVSFLHVDCDLYSSAKVIFENLDPLIIPGTIIVFDEYFNYPGWRLDEYKAFQEFVRRRKLSYAYEGFVSNHQQVCVRIL